MALNISDAIKIYGHPLTSVELTEKLDENDHLSKFRQEFVIPTLKSLSEVTGTRYNLIFFISAHSKVCIFIQTVMKNQMKNVLISVETHLD